jgi:hypothetical protein
VSARIVIALIAFTLAAPWGVAGPFSRAWDDPLHALDAPVPGFTGPHGIGKARVFIGTDDQGDPVFQHPGNFIHPLFFAWGAAVVDYHRADAGTAFADPSLALGPATGDAFDVVSLGELNATALAGGATPGSITLEFSRPIHNLSGADFVVFENSTLALYHYGGAGIGGIFGELAHVEVSADGEHFVRFPATALDGTAPGTYGSIDPTALHHLAGKHVNAYGECWGTPFDLAAVGLARATHLRIVDIPGDGSFRDAQGRPIRDPWPTFGSGGFDLDAVGVISTPLRYAEWPQLESLDPARRGPQDDPDGDGACNLVEFAQATLPWVADAVAPTIEVSDGHAQIRFRRDERMADVTLEVQASDSLAADSWVTLARATPGTALQATATPSPGIHETDLPGIAGIGVIRQCLVRDAHAISSSRTRYLRVKVLLHPAPIDP